MSQLALARRYRPQTFQTVIGQEASLRALKSALDTQHLHHAYLFTGTRGVGKTTLARILAKCLNCEQGISSNPCGVCSACQAIQAGSFVDVVEVDAASRTKVEDTRELLDNVQYLPTYGRFKIYIIDEVHMLSNHSFNALLKTLEEPPAHVKFLLATTDPQKLPATVLSRCLQFHLRRFPFHQVVGQLKAILSTENVLYESEALEILAHAAEGSMRDALSLLDQALAYMAGSDCLLAKDVRQLLGLTEKGRLLALLSAIAKGQAQLALQELAAMADFSPDFSLILTEFLSFLHQIAIAQQVPEAVQESILEREAIIKLASDIPPEQVQLFYQIALLGQKDLPYAPTARMGFEMVVLRMLAFQPAQIMDVSPNNASEKTDPVTLTRSVEINQARLQEATHLETSPLEEGEATKESRPSMEKVSKVNLPEETLKLVNEPLMSKDESKTELGSERRREPEESEYEPESEYESGHEHGYEFEPEQEYEGNDEHEQENKSVLAKKSDRIDPQPQRRPCLEVFPNLNVITMAKELARHCSVLEWTGDYIHLILDGTKPFLSNTQNEGRLQAALSEYLKKPIRLKVSVGEPKHDTLAVHQEKQQQKQQDLAQKKAEELIRKDPNVLKLINQFDAKIEEITVTASMEERV